VCPPAFSPCCCGHPTVCSVYPHGVCAPLSESSLCLRFERLSSLQRPALPRHLSLCSYNQSVQLERWSGQIGSPKWWLAEVLEQFPLLHIPTPLLTPTTLLGLADQLDRARLEKMYEGAEERLKQITHIAYEPRLEAPRCMSP
jgi:hypothetical protein